MITAQNLRELNRVLIAVDELHATTEGPLRASVVLACKQATLYGGFQDHEASLDTALRLALVVELPDSRVSLTDLGSHFLALNAGRYYELQPPQLPFLFRIAVEEGPLRQEASALRAMLDRDRASGTLILTAARLKELPRSLAACFSVLLFLNVFEQHYGLWRVRPDYLRQMGHLREMARISEAELRALLEEQATLGHVAEILTVEWERHRLRSKGAEAEALLVNRVSEIDVAAGYDVESFSGQSATLQPDRFIEVKASTSGSLRFFWTRHEFETARNLGPAYFIYFLGNFRAERSLSQFPPRVIQDPVATLPSLPNVHVEPRVYLVTEDSDTAEIGVRAVDF